MNIKWQSLFLVLLILVSLTLTRVGEKGAELASGKGENASSTEYEANLSYNRTSQTAVSDTVPPLVSKPPERNWSVLDPQINAQAVLIQSLDEDFPFLHYRTYQTWSIASISKLMTAVVVLENFGENKKIPISQTAVLTEGVAGSLESGEVYSARDLLKIMLITSSNDAAVAFEEYGGRDKFIRLINNKAGELGMKDTIFYDSSGLSAMNTSTANDILLLTKYIVKEHPDIFNWTRLQNILVQPLNNDVSKSLLNIDWFSSDSGFLGGKTGTSPAAKQNLLEIVSMGKYRIVVIALGMDNRANEIPALLDWVKRAYTF